MTLSGKIVLLLVVILSVAMVTGAGRGLWFGNQKGLYKGKGGKRDEVFDKTANDNGGVESKRKSLFSTPGDDDGDSMSCDSMFVIQCPDLWIITNIIPIDHQYYPDRLSPI
jgi:hypothetical protein